MQHPDMMGGIQEHINASITLTDGFNLLMENYDLIRIESREFSWQEQSPYLLVGRHLAGEIGH